MQYKIAYACVKRHFIQIGHLYAAVLKTEFILH